MRRARPKPAFSAWRLNARLNGYTLVKGVNLAVATSSRSDADRGTYVDQALIDAPGQSGAGHRRTPEIGGAADRAAGASDPSPERLRSAAETVALVKQDFARFGITRLGRITGLDTIGIPVWFATRPAAYTLAVTQGKGLDDASAQASAVMEAVEIATAERPSVELREASASMARLAARGERFDLLPSLLRRGGSLPPEDEPLSWAEGFDLVSGQTIRCRPRP